MPQLPDPEWLYPFEARDRALAIFTDSDPAAVERAILEAICDGKVETRDRCKKLFRDNEMVRLGAYLWDPELIRIRWDLDCFERTLGGETYLFIHVQLRRQDLENWFKHAVTYEMTARRISTGEITRTDNEPTLADNASYADVKAAVEKRGPEPEAALLAAVREELPGRHVPRQWVRNARDEVFGKPGRKGRPKSPR